MSEEITNQLSELGEYEQTLESQRSLVQNETEEMRFYAKHMVSFETQYCYPKNVPDVDHDAHIIVIPAFFISIKGD